MGHGHVLFSAAEVEAIIRALTPFSGGERRYESLAKRGASDAELRELIGREMGLGGGSSGPGRIAEWHVGGDNPRIWLHGWRSETPTIAGAELILVVRRLFAIGEPVPEGQLRLL